MSERFNREEFEQYVIAERPYQDEQEPSREYDECGDCGLRHSHITDIQDDVLISPDCLHAYHERIAELEALEGRVREVLAKMIRRHMYLGRDAWRDGAAMLRTALGDE